MSTSFRFVEGNGNLKYQRFAQLGVSKIYELAMEDDEVLKGLEDGEAVAGMTVEEIDRLSVRELKQKLRDAKKDKEDSRISICIKDKDASPTMVIRIIWTKKLSFR